VLLAAAGAKEAHEKIHDVVRSHGTDAAVPPTDPRALEDGRPECMPCQIVLRYSNGDMNNWWSLGYEDGRLVHARNEHANGREAAVRLKSQRLPLEQARAAVDADRADDPWTISYTYDAQGRRVGYSDGDAAVTFEYDGRGRLVSYQNGEGQHRLSHDAEGRVVSDSYSMTTMNMPAASRYEYDSSTPPEHLVPLVYGNGEIFFGEYRAYFSMNSGPENLLKQVEFKGPQEAVSRVQTYGMGGSPSDYFEFRYDCPGSPW